jgi:hypothetical protein
MWQLAAGICQARTISCRQPRATRRQIEPSKIAVAVDGIKRDRCWPLVDLSGRHDGSLLKDGVGQLYR